ncbi:MAG: hypothetical protein IT565_14385, partial [Rhodospirillales bacterium]|nr:hypothetical protein [Rhodospirillales bacterium]
MSQQRHLLALVALALVPVGMVVARARGAPSSEPPAADGADPAVAEANAHAAYAAHLAANNAAAERWKSAQGRNHTANRSTDDELVATNFGCPEGTQFWQRDRLTELCATPCTSDLDCAPEEGR